MDGSKSASNSVHSTLAKQTQTETIDVGEKNDGANFPLFVSIPIFFVLLCTFVPFDFTGQVVTAVMVVGSMH